MPRYKIIFDREACIGALACARVAPEFYLIADDGKVDLKGAKYNKKTKKFELTIDHKDLFVNKDAEDICPVKVIEIIELMDEAIE